MQRCRRVKIVTVVAVISVTAAVSAWAVPALAAQRQSTLKFVAGTVSCTTSQGSLQITAYAYRPDPYGYAAAFVYTGPPNTPATIPLVDIETDKSGYKIDHGCVGTKASVRLTHRGLTSAGVVQAGYYQFPTAYCGVPSRVVVRYRIGIASSGKPATATVAVWAKRKKSSRLREIGYVHWSRSRSVTYYTRKACVGQS